MQILLILLEIQLTYFLQWIHFVQWRVMLLRKRDPWSTSYQVSPESCGRLPLLLYIWHWAPALEQATPGVLVLGKQLPEWKLRTALHIHCDMSRIHLHRYICSHNGIWACPVHCSQLIGWRWLTSRGIPGRWSKWCSAWCFFSAPKRVSGQSLATLLLKILRACYLMIVLLIYHLGNVKTCIILLCIHNDHC